MNALIISKSKFMASKPNFEYEARFKGMSLAASFRAPKAHASYCDGEPMPWKPEDKPTTSSSPSPKKET